MIKKIAIAIVVILIAIQFIRVDTVNPTPAPEKDFINVTQPSKEVADLLKTSCYDCHSNETKYPWYFNVAPVSWWLKNHINEGREELNFSLWADFDAKRKDKKLEESVELINEGEMPMFSYTLTHKEAKLNAAQQKALNDYFTALRTFEKEEEE
jgi:hypothetical protein